MYEPAMAFDSKSARDGLVVLVDAVSRKGKPMVAAVHLHSRSGKAAEATRNVVASIHAKDGAGFVRHWINDGLLRYLDKKKADVWNAPIGRQLPKGGLAKARPGTSTSAKKKILTPSDVFKNEKPASERFSLREGPTEMPEFRRWFGDSKVVDAEGLPLVVYHGTIEDFEAFEEGHKSDGVSRGRGFYFSADPEVATSYSYKLGVPTRAGQRLW